MESSQPSLWYKDAVIYQLHVKAYADGDGDGIGDFAGLIEKLPYIKALGATAIWLLPFYPSPLRDDGYDISEYKGVNPSYGTMRDVRTFIKAAHKLGLKIITELVVNHTSDQHPWFQRARTAPRDSSYRKFYVWNDSPETYAGTRIIFTDTETSNWQWDQVAGQYYWHRFFSHQPDLNFDHPPVFEAISEVMRFWFAMGVDGMRLDAVPYLCEREGTTSENLPETHALLKRLRAIVDAEFPERLLLAEANQWPEDVNAYFGDGDECQMAFHFPLMPRMFMSIAEEDRYPLYDIMRQTPQIPANCQWAIFLRNHDELTLEMVTDRERAFMYSVYAQETRARVNVGIRRRLAPLMENDRGKIQLMTSLLLSMPGTPIVYYGDEIGMGDNIYLGDRDGVRTPMQWSADRNGGFSRADTQRLFLPPIMDPVYGYASVNAEAQERSSSSLLQWMRRIIGVRQAHRVFGRGGITFLHPDNRHIAAYVREYEGEVVLCVANLARTSQAVSLDLSRYNGRTPVEMIGWSAFPPIVDDRYVITLHGYGFFWFVLAAANDAPVAIVPAAPQPPEFITIVLPHGRVSLLTGAARTTLERDVLPTVLNVRQMLAPGTQPEAIAVTDIVPLGATDDAPAIAILGASAEHEALILPLEVAHAVDREWPLPTLRAAFAKIRTGPREGLLLDAAIDDRLWCGLFDAMRANATLPGNTGALHCESTWNLESLAIAEETHVRRPQSGDRRLSAVIGETVLITLYRRSVRGINPAIELARFFHEANFTHTAPLLGTFTYRDGGGGEVGVGLARRYILAQGSGWDVLHTLFMRSLETNAEDGVPIDRIVALAGRRLAGMHALLARSEEPDFVPGVFSAADVATLQGELRDLAERAFTQIARDRSPEAAAALALRAQIERIIAGAPLAGALAMRVHGDFHLERVLVTESDVLIIDPGVGEASRPEVQRRRRTSPFADLATMIRSLDEVAAAAAFDVSTDPTVATEEVMPKVRALVRAAATTFARSYLAHARELGALGALEEGAGLRALVDVFLVRATLEAIVYQAHARPERMRDLYAEFTRIFERSEVALIVMTPLSPGRFGPLALEHGYRLRLYAPAAKRVEAHVDGRVLAMVRDGDWFMVDDGHARAGSRYAFAADGRTPVPDPGSRFQPDGVHAASEIVPSHFAWPDDGWHGRPWHEHVIYELHVGTFTFEGTYESAAHKLRELVALGVTAIELMPIAAFPGARNWGYDGVLLYAPYAGYGKPDDLRRFIAAAHAHGLAVLLDVVYNHFGPEGNYLHALAPAFFNDAEHTPWGAAIDVRPPDVRAYFAENAAYWLNDFRFDGLRLDATQTIIDPQAPSFLAEIRATALAPCAPGRHVALVVENDYNDAALLDTGYDAQWNDDVHHCAHVIVTGEAFGFYRDYASDPVGRLGRALATGFAYQGETSKHRKGMKRGAPSARFPLSAFISFLQNHDMIGNRAFGERLAQLAPPEALRALTALILLAPSPPMLFMGEEWNASTPFLFFCDFEPGLAKLVTEGRRREFAAFPQFADAAVRATIPDPSALGTFEASRLRWEERAEPQHAAALAFTTTLLQLRAEFVMPATANVRGTDAACERIGTTGLKLRWKLAGGVLHADANLSGAELDGFPERATGETFYATHREAYRGGRAPAWAVRWSRT